MLKVKALVLGGVLCLLATACYADSVSTIPITGTTYDGFATTQGDYRIQGPGLSLWEGTLGGPSFIGECTLEPSVISAGARWDLTHTVRCARDSQAVHSGRRKCSGWSRT